ncbi:MAG: hypothetical protein KTR31_08115 [Myxococcales bacterium]|nr:hypothetical protein [Myxococcales bacterium]
MWAVLRDVWIRGDGGLRGPLELWWLLRGWWLSMSLALDLPPPALEDRCQRAIALLRAAGADRRLEHVAWLGLTTALRDQGLLDEASEAARHLTHDPAAAGAGDFWIASRYVESGHPALGLPWAERALVAAQRTRSAGLVVDASAVVALCLQRMGKEPEAAALAAEGMTALLQLPADCVRYEETPTTEGVLLHTMAAALPVGSAEAVAAARRAFDRAAQEHRASLGAHLAHALHDAGQHAECVAVIEQVIGRAEAPERLACAALLGHTCVVHLGRPAEGVRVLQEALDLVQQVQPPFEQRASMRLDLARGALAVGDHARAAEAARAVLALQHAGAPTVADFVARDPVAAFGRPPTASARVAEQQLIEAQRRLGQALWAQGDLEGAREALQGALGRCRDALLTGGQEAVSEQLEAAITAELRDVIRRAS